MWLTGVTMLDAIGLVTNAAGTAKKLVDLAIEIKNIEMKELAVELRSTILDLERRNQPIERRELAANASGVQASREAGSRVPQWRVLLEVAGGG